MTEILRILRKTTETHSSSICCPQLFNGRPKKRKDKCKSSAFPRNKRKYSLQQYAVRLKFSTAGDSWRLQLDLTKGSFISCLLINIVSLQVNPGLRVDKLPTSGHRHLKISIKATSTHVEHFQRLWFHDLPWQPVPIPNYPFSEKKLSWFLT